MKMLKDKKLYIFLVITIIYFGLLCRLNYSVDTYLLFASPRMGYIMEYLSCGRIFTTAYFFLLNLLQVPHFFMYLLSFILGIIFTTLSIYELSKIFDKYVKNKLLSSLIAIFIIINPCVIELWLFIEMGIMMFSVFAIVKAFKHFELFIDKKDKKDKKELILAFVFMLLSVFSYQGTAALFIALATIPILFKSKKIRTLLINTIFMGLVYGVPTVINYAFTLIFANKRTSGTLTLTTIFDNLRAGTHAIIESFRLYPGWFIPLILLFLIIILAYYMYKTKKKFIALLNIIYIVGLVYLFTMAPIIIQTTDRLAVYPRSCYACYTFIGILLVLINKKIDYKILCIFLIPILLFEFLTFTRIETNRYIVNKRDKEIIMKIEEKVKKYEEENNTKATKMNIYNLENSTIFYKDIMDNINVSAIKENPSGIAAYSYFTGRKIDNVVIRSGYNTYFMGYEKDEFDLEQIIIDGDTIHWYLY